MHRIHQIYITNQVLFFYSAPRSSAVGNVWGKKNDHQKSSNVLAQLDIFCLPPDCAIFLLLAVFTCVFPFHFLLLFLA